MSINRFLLPLILAGGLCSPVSALADVADEQTIVEHITSVNSNEIIMPDELLKRVSPDSDVPVEDKTREVRPASGRMAGYRVQVFSDSNTRTAKATANSKARQLRSRFPQYQTHVMFSSPYWRLRVGDFRTHAEAEAAASLIRSAFPAMSKEIRVVKDRVTIVAE